ncbi:MAG: L-threonylcarbamoyladenylate synthase [Ktedonobacteraceae bacterium]
MQYTLTRVLSIHPEEPSTELIEEAAALLRKGELVVFPTETVYGLGADALQTRAVERIFAAKGRPFSDPLIVHIADQEEWGSLVTAIPPIARRLAEAFWPGPLTLVLPAGPRVPRLITAGLPNVAIRMPAHPVALALIRAAGTPIAAPSANRFMHVSPTTAQHALADLNGNVPLILDAGPSKVGVESTVLDLCADRPTILRPGGISIEALQAIIPDVLPPQPRKMNKAEEIGQGAPGEQEVQVAQAAPGQMLVHYAPTVPAFLFEGSVAEMHTAMLIEIQRRQAQGERVGLLIADEDLATFQTTGALVYSLGSTPEQVATRLFAGLRALEEAGVQVILCRSFTQDGIGMAVRDRLLKAAGGKIFKYS